MQQQLSQATITIKQIFENEKGPSKVLDTQGKYWKVWPDVLEQLNLKTNAAYEIKYKPGEYNGKPDNVIKSAIGTEAPTNGHTHSNGHAHSGEIVATNACASVFGMVNSYISIGAVANDIEAIAGLIDKCEQGFLRSQIGKRSIGG